MSALAASVSRAGEVNSGATQALHPEYRPKMLDLYEARPTGMLNLADSDEVSILKLELDTR